jgi:hypothetical protein
MLMQAMERRKMTAQKIATQIKYKTANGLVGEVFVRKDDMFEYLDIMNGFDTRHLNGKLTILEKNEVVFDENKNQWVKI